MPLGQHRSIRPNAPRPAPTRCSCSRPRSTDESEFIVDARNTRLGFDVVGPQIPFFDCAQSGGKVEIDFQNSVLSTENKATILLRHAYAEVKNEEFRLLVGQTWDVISPLESRHVDVLGRLGRRQHRLPPGTVPRRAIPGLLRHLAGDRAGSRSTSRCSRTARPTSAGEPSNWPICEGRVAWTIGERGKGCLPITVGVSGHIGEEEFDSVVFGPNNRRRTWSGNIDVRVPITERLGVQGECFIGENLGAFLGGIGQGVDPVTGNTIRAAGGWFEVWYDWTPRLHSHVGYSVDDPNDHDLVLAAEKSYNQFYFGNSDLRSDEELPGRHGSQFVEDDLRRTRRRAIRSAASSW